MPKSSIFKSCQGSQKLYFFSANVKRRRTNAEKKGIINSRYQKHGIKLAAFASLEYRRVRYDKTYYGYLV
jgi:hypothetical protein